MASSFKKMSIKVRTPRANPLGATHRAKGSNSQVLPDRHTLNTLTKGDPAQRSLNNYARQTPSGIGALGIPSLIPGNPFE